MASYHTPFREERVITGHSAHTYFSSCRLITTRWIWLVPS